MANANAIGDQLVKLGLRHGEKLGIAIASTVFFLCVGGAVSKKSIDTTPDQVKKAAESSEQNLNRHEERETIIKNLEEREKIVPTNFAQTVDEQIKVTLNADQFKAARPWVTPEPGAGLIRDQPTLIAPNEIYAYPGRGGFLVFALDKEGERSKMVLPFINVLNRFFKRLITSDEPNRLFGFHPFHLFPKKYLVFSVLRI